MFIDLILLLNRNRVFIRKGTNNICAKSKNYLRNKDNNRSNFITKSIRKKNARLRQSKSLRF